ncbi:uncharacterized protein LOC116251369 [Nymphaea colorata]|nr:uncharacterized protein LOC116251369 [Nymphaea colorata]
MPVIAALVFLLSSLFLPCSPQETLSHAPPFQVGQLKVSSYNIARKLRLGDKSVGRECGAADWQCPSRSEAAGSAYQQLTRATEVTAVPIAGNDQNEEKAGEFFSMDYNSPTTHLPINN